MTVDGITLEAAYDLLINNAYRLASDETPRPVADVDAYTRRIEALVALAREIRLKARERGAP